MAHNTAVLMPPISVVISTRDRSESLVRTVRSIFLSDYPNFELIVVDQSSDNQTYQALQPFMQESHFKYIRSEQLGLAVGRNTGIAAARTELVACTDDDCEVGPEWLKEMASALATSPKIGLVFGNVVAGTYDQSLGFVPAYVRSTPYLARTLKEKNQVRGIGACMGLRRSAWQTVGGFDPTLGSGGQFKSCEDGDMTVKMLLNDFYVYETPKLNLTHYGFRTWEQGKALAWRDWFGIGAAYMKHLRLGHFGIGRAIAHEAAIALSGFIITLIKERRIGRVRPMLAYLIGLLSGCFASVDRAHNNYVARKAVEAHRHISISVE